MIFRTTILSAFALLLIVSSYGQEGGRPKAKAEVSDTLGKPKASILSRATFTQNGYITVLKSKDSYYLSIPDSIMDRDLLFVCRVEQISNNKAISAGQIRKDPILIRFSKRAKQVAMELPLKNKYLVNSPELTTAFDANNIIAENEFFDIAERDEKGKSTIIDVTKYFADDIDLVSPWSGKKPGKLEAKGVSIEKMKANEQTVEISTILLYSNEREPIKVKFRYSIVLLPKEPMQPRFGDSRVGYFSQVKREFESAKQVEATRYISRWRLEPKPEDRARYFAGELVEPQKQIVFYIDPAMPAQWRGYAKQGIEDWNAAFEEIGFKNVMVAKDYPTNDPNFDPYDFRNNCLIYLLVEDANASGELYADPRSGEIIQADIFWYHNVLRLLQEWRYVQTAAADTSIRKFTFTDAQMGEMIRYAVAHETGHTLGLQHNMRASYAFPVDSLRSATFTQKYGTTASIMDYARNNYVAQPGDKGVKLTPPILGDYDRLAIKFGYKLIKDATDPHQELPIVEKWFREKGLDPKYLFCPMTAAEIQPNPAGQADAIGDDAVKASEYGIKNQRFIMKNLASWTYTDATSTDLLDQLYAAVVKQYGKMMSNTMAYLGGEYQYYGTMGQFPEMFTVVSAEHQKRALSLMMRELKNIGWLNEPSVTKYIGLKTGEIYKYQNDVVEKFFGNFILNRIAEGEASGKGYTVSAYISDFTTLLLQPTKAGSLSVYEKNLQVFACKKLASIRISSDLQPEQSNVPASVMAALKMAKTTIQQLAVTSTVKADKEHYQYLLTIVDTK